MGERQARNCTGNEAIRGIRAGFGRTRGPGRPFFAWAPFSGVAESLQSYRDVKEQIRRSVDLVDLVSEHVSLKRAGRSFKGLCPFHRENTPSFNVWPDHQIFKCFGCSATGDVFTFVEKREGVGFVEALRILADRIGLRLETRPKGPKDGPEIGRADIARANEWAAQWFRRELLSERGAAARAYVSRRGISSEAAEQFQIGAALPDARLVDAAGRAGFSIPLLLAADLVRAGDHGGVYETFRDRLIFPIRDASRRCLGFGGRTLIDAPAKYLNTAQTELFDKGRCLFGLDHARTEIGRRGEVVLVEGYTDCIACHQQGFRHVIATLGTAATDDHMAALRRYADNVILFFDSDPAGDAAAERAAAVAMRHNLRVRLAKVPEGKDPAEFLETSGAQAFAVLLNSAVDALGFLWDRTLARFQNQSGGQDRARAVGEFVHLVGELSRFGAVDAIQRGLIINQVARLLGLPVGEVSGMFVAPPRRADARPITDGAGAKRVPARAEPSADHEQLALTELFGVLLCRPALYPQVGDIFRPDRFQDAELRALAESFLGLASTGNVEFSALLASTDSPEAVSRLTSLMLSASDRGSHEEAVLALRRRLALLDGERAGRAASAALRSAGGGGPWSNAEVDSHLVALQEGYARRHGFSPLAVPAPVPAPVSRR